MKRSARCVLLSVACRPAAVTDTVARRASTSSAACRRPHHRWHHLARGVHYLRLRHGSDTGAHCECRCSRCSVGRSGGGGCSRKWPGSGRKDPQTVSCTRSSSAPAPPTRWLSPSLRTSRPSGPSTCPNNSLLRPFSAIGQALVSYVLRSSDALFMYLVAGLRPELVILSGWPLSVRRSSVPSARRH
jgi:hypothetical protein